MHSCVRQAQTWFPRNPRQHAELDGTIRLEGGSSGAGYQYGRLEVFMRGFWSNVCADSFTPDSVLVACRALGFDGGAALRFVEPFNSGRTFQEVHSLSL